MDPLPLVSCLSDSNEGKPSPRRSRNCSATRRLGSALLRGWALGVAGFRVVANQYCFLDDLVDKSPSPEGGVKNPTIDRPDLFTHQFDSRRLSACRRFHWFV